VKKKGGDFSYAGKREDREKRVSDGGKRDKRDQRGKRV